MKDYLSIKEQIKLLKLSGLTFKDMTEHEARSLLANEAYYHKVISYKHYFNQFKSRRDEDYFNGLDFFDLYEYYKIDNQLKENLNDICLDVENFFKVYMMREIDECDFYEAPAYCYYDIIDVERRFKVTNKMEKRIRDYNDVYSKKNLKKFPDKKPIWVLNEYLAFGEVIEIYSKFMKDNNIKKEEFNIEILLICKNLRNITAHGNKLFVDQHNIFAGDQTLQNLYLKNFGIMLSDKYFNNHFKSSILATLYTFKLFAPKEIFLQRIDDLYKTLHSITKNYKVFKKYPEEQVVNDIKLLAKAVNNLY